MRYASAVALVGARLAASADPVKAAPMAAYLKTDMPFYGVQKKERVPILRELVREFPPGDERDYRDTVMALWSLPHREEKYLALGYARAFDRYITVGSMGLFERLIVEGAWWDLVDEAASRLVGGALMVDRPEVTPVVRPWAASGDLWLRRSAIICQLTHREQTDTGLLEEVCVGNLEDQEFFIRKAIGWALRQYARTDPEWVRTFVDTHRDRMSGLSIREATKHI